MARTASFVPTLNKSRKALGKAPWCLSIPPHLSPTGKQQRLFYPTQQRAKLEAQKLQTRSDNFGISLTHMSAARISEAAEAFNLLEGTGLKLLDVVRSGLLTHKARTESVSFLNLFDQFIEAKAGRDPKYLKELRQTRDRFSELHPMLVSDIMPRNLESLLSKLSPGGRNAVMRYLRALFNYGLKRRYLSENPISRLDFVPRIRREVEIIPNHQVSAMLHDAWQHDLPLLPFLTIGFFLGVRCDGEVQQMMWSDIDLTDSVAVIRPEVAKTRRRRFVDISANAKNWLLAYQNRSGSQTGKIVPYTEAQLRRRRRKNWQVAGITRWVSSGMRHCFCSNWLMLNRDVNKLVLMSGHDSADVLWRHYFKAVSEASAREFWMIAPPPEPASNIVRFG
jgi:integrase